MMTCRFDSKRLSTLALTTQTVARSFTVRLDLLMRIGKMLVVNGLANGEDFPTVLPLIIGVFETNDLAWFCKLNWQIGHHVRTSIIAKLTSETALSIHVSFCHRRFLS